MKSNDIALVVDSSAFRKTFTMNSLGIRALVELCKSNAITLYIPRVVFEECRTASLNDHKVALDTIIKNIKMLARREMLPKASSQIASTLSACEKISEELDNQISKTWDTLLSDTDAILLDIRPEHTEKVFRSYFAGTAPFKKLKSREDIPDAFIYQCVDDLCRDLKEVHFICTDKYFREQIEKLGKSHCYHDFDEFLSSKLVKGIRKARRLRKPFIKIECLWSFLEKNTVYFREKAIKRLKAKSEGLFIYDKEIPCKDNKAYILSIKKVKYKDFSTSHYSTGYPVIYNELEIVAEALLMMVTDESEGRNNKDLRNIIDRDIYLSAWVDFIFPKDFNLSKDKPDRVIINIAQIREPYIYS